MSAAECAAAMEHAAGEDEAAAATAASDGNADVEHDLSSRAGLDGELGEKDGAGGETEVPLESKRNLQSKGSQGHSKPATRGKNVANGEECKVKKGKVSSPSRPKVCRHSPRNSAEDCTLQNNADGNAVVRDETDPADMERHPVKESKEKKKLQHLPNQQPPVIAEDHSDASSFSSSAGIKPHKVASMPTYGFTFKCDERAEKRKEFYHKLEEKTQAKELERSTLQAKSKENEEAELKMLRKSLNFKATPMPSFYQEPPPPKAQLKKIPTTRAKSPKFGRNKSSSAIAESEQSSTRSGRPARRSFDDRKDGTVLRKVTPSHSKKQQRKSLPRLPSQGPDPTDTPDNNGNSEANHELEQNPTPENGKSESSLDLEENKSKEAHHVETDHVEEETAEPKVSDQLLSS